MAKITEYLEVFTKEYLLNTALNEVPDDVDKREGAIIYDALSICCDKLADTFMELKKIVEQGYIITATDDTAVDYRVAERGIYRYEATQAQRLGTFTYSDDTPANIQIGALFSTIDENKENVVNYEVVAPYIVDDIIIPGSYVLVCKTPGTVGNSYFGEILPLSDMDTLGSATLTTVLVPARDVEETEDVKKRYFATFNLEAFGGNIADYKKYMENFTGVGQTQIYPRVETDFNIILSCVDPTNQPISTEYQNTIKAELDPENYYNNGNNTSGMGLGVVPIGHKVVVTAPQTSDINVSLKVIIGQSAHLPTVIDNIETNLQNYITQVQDSWADGDGDYKTVIYYNQILATAISAEGVTNITECLVNGETQDITLEQNRTIQYIPKLGTVEVSEVQ